MARIMAASSYTRYSSVSTLSYQIHVMDHIISVILREVSKFLKKAKKILWTVSAIWYIKQHVGGLSVMLKLRIMG